MMAWLTDFHFLRPWWLLALVPGVFLVFSRRVPAMDSSSWRRVIAPSLLPFLTRPAERDRRQRHTRWLLALVWSLICIALAGPTAVKLPQPLQRDTSALVVLFDLSPSMRTRDLTPDRLTRARLKTIDVLRERRDGMTGLVVYGGDAFTLVPMTPDLNTVLHLIRELEPEIMPTAGSHVEGALQQGLELLLNGGHRTGRVLLVTDGMTYDAQKRIEQLMRQFSEYRVDILGVGTSTGGPIPLPDGTFARGSDGRVVVDSLPEQRLRNLAGRAGGRYATLTGDDRDLDHLLTSYRQPHSDRDVEPTTDEFDVWHDLGYWLALALLPLIFLLFRRGVVAALVICLPLSVHSPPAAAFSWKHWWTTPDQRGSRALAEGNAAQAANEFEDPAWRGMAAFEAGDYQAAEELFGQQNTPLAHYNRGNALAAQGRFSEAVDAYDEALARAPDLAAAQHNRARAEELLQQQEQETAAQGDGDSHAESPNPRQEAGSQQGDSQEADRSTQPSPADSSQTDSSPQAVPSADVTDKSGQRAPDASGGANSGTEQAPEAAPNGLPSESADNSLAPESHAQPMSQSSADEEELNLDGHQSSLPHDPRNDQMEQRLRRVPEDPGGLLRRQLQREALLRARESQRARSMPPGSEQDRW